MEEDESIDLLRKALELRDAYKHKLLNQGKDDSASFDIKNTAMLVENMKEPVIVKIPRYKWKELFSVFLLVIRLHKLRMSRRLSESEIKSKLENVASFWYLSRRDVNLYEDEFQIEVVSKEPDLGFAAVSTATPGVVEKKQEEVKVKPREERYGGSQMSLREKKITGRTVEELSNISNDGLFGIVDKITKTSLDQQEYEFYMNQLSMIFNVDVHASQTPSKENLTDHVLKEMSSKFMEENLNQDRPNLERNIFSGLTPAEVELIEERDLFQYYNEKLQGKKLMFHELVKGVLDYLLSVRKHELSSSGFAFESQSLEGPSPLLGWGE